MAEHKEISLGTIPHMSAEYLRIIYALWVGINVRPAR